MNQEIKSKIKQIIIDKNGVRPEKVTDEANFKEDLGMDSLECMELIIEIEDEFSISVPDDEAVKVSNLSDCVALVEKHLK